MAQNKTKKASRGRGEGQGVLHQAPSAQFQVDSQVLSWKGYIFELRNPGFRSYLRA